MKYICVTEVDAVTKIPCTVAPQHTGPSFPDVKGLEYKWANQSTWPVSTDSTGIYLRAPKYYCFCDDDADIDIPGVLEVLTEAEWIFLEIEEMEARKPHPSWSYDPDTKTYAAPIPRPADAIMNGGNVAYQWDESILNWVPIENQP